MNFLFNLIDTKKLKVKYNSVWLWPPTKKMLRRNSNKSKFDEIKKFIGIYNIHILLVNLDIIEVWTFLRITKEDWDIWSHEFNPKSV